MNTLKTEEQCTAETMEQRLSKVGHQIDELMARAEKAKKEVEKKLDVVRNKEEQARKRGEAALDELKLGLDNAWHELNQAWDEIKLGGERATTKLLSREKHTCCSKEKTESAACKDDSAAP
jgi:hypothetical protein